MKITATHDDGTAADITALVRHAYEALWETTRFDRDWEPDDVEKFAALARALRHPSADLATELAEQVRAEDERSRAYLREVQTERVRAMVAVLDACG